MKGNDFSSILKLVDSSLLDNIAATTSVDYKAKKLKGEVVFKLLLLTLLDDSKMSLRLMQQLYQSQKFRLLMSTEEQLSISHSSLSERLCSINVEYFKLIFEQLNKTIKDEHLPNSNKYVVRQFDSTSISTSAKLLSEGMVSGAKSKFGEHNVKQVKFTIGLYEQMPADCKLFTEQKYVGDDEPLKQAILAPIFANNEIVVFDRGLKSRASFQLFKQQNIMFVTRINPTKIIQVVEVRKLPKDSTTATLKIESDEMVYLSTGRSKKLKEAFRLIKAKRKATGEILFFVTNCEWLDAIEITEIYKQRWEIEIFFKFIKQHLHAKHFFNYSKNGIEVMMYMSLIAAILILKYKKAEKINSYKVAKYSFVEKLEIEVIKEIVSICGGNPAKYFKNDTS
jgi:hypothetical protein